MNKQFLHEFNNLIVTLENENYHKEASILSEDFIKVAQKFQDENLRQLLCNFM